MRLLCFINSADKAIVLLGYESVSLGYWLRALRDTAVVSQFDSQEPSDTALYRRRRDKPSRDYLSVRY